MNPLLLFPEEIWEMILHQVEDSRDVRNVFLAFPQLDGNHILQKKKRLWLFGLVLPHLIPPEYTSREKEAKLLKFRLVCRHWSMEVDKFLETQSNPDVIEPPGKFPWNTKIHLENEGAEVRLRCGKYYGGTKISDPASLSKFLRDMEDHPPGRNPFLSRLLKLSTPSDFWPRNDKTFWKDIHILHGKFGENIWNYSLYLGLNWMESRPRFITPFITKCFPRLHNLRRFHIGITDNPHNSAMQEMGPLANMICKGLGSLPHLETLRITTDNEILRRALLAKYGSQILRLEFQFTEGCFDQLTALTMAFENLTELFVDVGYPNHINDLRKFLQKVEALKLVKLQFLLYNNLWKNEDDPERCDFWIENDVFQWLKKFPKLRFVDFGEECRVVRTREEGTLNPDLDSAPSLQFLSIRTSLEMSYNFLRCLPSLQHLHLYVHSEPVVHDGSPNANPIVRIREEIQHANMYMSDIWELLPKLKTVTLLKKLFVHPKRWRKWEFSREGYEYQVRNGFPCSKNDVPVRLDIIDFIIGGLPRRFRTSGFGGWE